MSSRLLSESAIRVCKRSEFPAAVVIGTNITGLSEARALNRFGIPVIGVDERMRRYASYSSAWSGVVLTEEFNGPGLIDVLLRLAVECGRRPTLFLSTDEQVKVIAQHGGRLRDAYNFDFPSRETVDLLMSKESFTAFAAEKGWPIPLTIAATDRNELIDKMRVLRYPAVLKPRVKNLAARTHSSQKAYRCNDAEAVLRAYDDIAQWEPEVVVQEWIPGTDADVHYSFHYFASDMREICTFEGHKIRQWIPEVGNTASSEPVDPPRVSDLSREILTTVRCCGFCSVEYKRDPRTGQYFITEPTVGRVNLQLGTALANGADLVARAYFHLNAIPYPGNEQRTFDRKWLLLAADYKSARFYMARGELTWAAYLRSLRGPKAYAVWRASDAGMLTGVVRDFASRAPQALARRLRRMMR